MSQATYRRKAILTRIHKALDAFYLLQKIDWEYDVRSTLEKILGLALGEIEFEEGKHIERGLIIVEEPEGGKLEIHAGWKAGDADLSFSRTVVQQTIARNEAILCENAVDDPRFMEAESIKGLETLSLISVPILFDTRCAGALYIESKSPRNIFNAGDLGFLKEFTGTISPYVKTALTHRWHLKTLRRLQEQVSGQYRFSGIIGRSLAMKNVFDLLKVAAGIDRTVLITGESGCGKELIAHAIHYNGTRRLRPFVVVDCSSLAEHLLESELFGHRRGAFTGASSDKTGAFEEADGGTIFLDEISDASRNLQQKLRRVLEEGEIRRVGDNAVRKVDVRVICATNKSLPELVARGDFMRDLYYRINKFPIHVPPLRERREDISLLVDHFLEQAAEQTRTPRKKASTGALELLLERDWADNNVRELRNTVELCVDFCEEGEISPAVVRKVFHLHGNHAVERNEGGEAAAARASGGGRLVDLHHGELERLLQDAARRETPAPSRLETPFYRIQIEASALTIIQCLRQTGWKLRPAARLLGISPTKLRNDLKEFLEQTVVRCAGNIDSVSRELDIPSNVLRRKIADLGLESAPTGVES